MAVTAVRIAAPLGASVIIGGTQQLIAYGTTGGVESALPTVSHRKSFGICYTNDQGTDVNGFGVDYFYSGYPGSTPHAKTSLVAGGNATNGPTGPDIHGLAAAPKTVFLRIGWNLIQTGPSTYDWQLFDKAIERCIAAGKFIHLSCSAGDDVPAWVETHPTKPVPLYTFKFVPGSGAGQHARPVRLPDNRNVNYIFLYTAFIAAVAQRCRDRGYAQWINHVKIGGFNYTSEEVRIPASDGTAQAADGDFSSDDLTFWTGRGYTPASMMIAWQAIVDAYAAAWPDTEVSCPIIATGAGMPKYGGSAPCVAINSTGVGGYPADLASKSSKVQYDNMLAYGRTKFGNRFAVNWNAVNRFTTSQTNLLVAYANLGYTIGYQLTESEMGNPQCPTVTGTPVGGPPYGNLSAPSHGGLGPCDATLLYNYGSTSLPGALDVGLKWGTKDLGTGLHTGANWMEIFQNDVVAYPTNLIAGDAAYRARDNTCRWTSSDTSIVSVSHDGIVTGVAVGSAVISAYHVASGITDTQTIDVLDNANVITTVGSFEWVSN